MGKADGELFKDKIEVSLDGRQIFYLFFGGAVIASLVFVLGVMVGRRVESRSSATASVASPTHDPLAALDQLEVKPAPELAFPAALRGDVNSLGVVDSAIAAIEDGESVGADDVESTNSARQPKPEPKKPEPKKPAPKPEAQKTPAPKPEPAAKPAKPEPKTADNRSDSDDGDNGGAKFTLQLSSFQDRAEAEAFFQEMENAGYSPYIVEADVPDRGKWFRVRLGSYNTYGDAIAAKGEFEKAQRIIAYVTRVKR